MILLSAFSLISTVSTNSPLWSPGHTDSSMSWRLLVNVLDHQTRWRERKPTWRLFFITSVKFTKTTMLVQYNHQILYLTFLRRQFGYPILSSDHRSFRSRAWIGTSSHWIPDSNITHLPVISRNTQSQLTYPLILLEYIDSRVQFPQFPRESHQYNHYDDINIHKYEQLDSINPWFETKYIMSRYWKRDVIILQLRNKLHNFTFCEVTSWHIWQISHIYIKFGVHSSVCLYVRSDVSFENNLKTKVNNSTTSWPREDIKVSKRPSWSAALDEMC